MDPLQALMLGQMPSQSEPQGLAALLRPQTQMAGDVVPFPNAGGLLNTPAQRRAFRAELLAGKKAYEDSLPPSNVTVPMPFLMNAINRKLETK
jgi:hypothetical protein